MEHIIPLAEGTYIDSIHSINKDNGHVEDFNFQYDLEGPYQPRIYNDMITLKSNSALIKLTISHGLAQSVKLSLFENIMDETITGIHLLTQARPRSPNV